MRRATTTTLAALALVALAGCGSSADAPAATTSAAATSATSAPSAGGTSAATSGAATYTLAQVQQHADSSSCWSAINGEVYDLTAWISQHPGGPDKIEGLCGTDGTAKFTGQHGNDSAPPQRLAGFKIGTLG